MAKEQNPVDMPVPSEGGSYIRDDKTGALTRATNHQPTDPAAEPASPVKE
jgi:hypothetical protein